MKAARAGSLGSGRDRLCADALNTGLVFLPEPFCARLTSEKVLRIAIAPKAIARLPVPVPVFGNPSGEPPLHLEEPMIRSKVLPVVVASAPSRLTDIDPSVAIV
jgi:hypothetical protein